MDHSGHGMTIDIPPFTLGRGLELGPRTILPRWRLPGGTWPVRLGGCAAGAARGDELVGRADHRLRARRADRDARDVRQAERLRHGDVQRAHGATHGDEHALAEILILLGAPITLALRRAAGGRHARQQGAARTAPDVPAQPLHADHHHPAFTIPLFIASLYALSLPHLRLPDGLQKNRAASVVHFLAVGLVFFWPIMGVDPGPHGRAI